MTKMMKNDEEEEEEAVRKAIMSDTVNVHVHVPFFILSFLLCCCHDDYLT